MWEQGLWNFDDPVSKHIPQFANLEVMSGYDEDGNVSLEPLKRQPTMRELVSHSAGFVMASAVTIRSTRHFRDKEVLNSANLMNWSRK